MCIKKGCNSHYQRQWGSLTCECNKSCYSCYSAYRFDKSGWDYKEPYQVSLADVRKKFVCFPCKRIWKSSISKYIAHKVCDKYDGYEEYLMKSLNKVDDDITIPFNKKKQLKRKIKYNYPFLYNGISKCACCGNTGISVGRNFRHCKTNKEWKYIEEKYKNNEIGLYNDFHDYPREGNDNTKRKLENNTNSKYAEIIRNKIPIYNC